MLASTVTKNKPYEAGQGLSQKARSLAEMLQRHPTLTYTTAGVESRPKSIPYPMQNMETLLFRATPFVAAPTARPGSGDSMEMTEKANAGV
jgi:hypothetical protein